MGINSRQKGSVNERKIAQQLKAYWGHGDWVRTPLSGGWATPATREAFRTCGDIMTTALDWPFCPELKKHEKWTLDQLIHNEACKILGWWDQVIGETPPDLIPLLIFARNRIPQAVMFDDAQVHNLVGTSIAPPWYAKPHFLFHLKGRDLIITSLESFFSINPDLFGRKMPVSETGRPKPGDRPTVPEPVIPTCIKCKKPLTSCSCSDNDLKK